MAKTKQPFQPAPLFENYEDSPTYRWYINELYDLMFTINMNEKVYRDKPKELYWRAKCIELREVLIQQLENYLSAKYKFSWDRITEIIANVDQYMTEPLDATTKAEPTIPNQEQEVSNG
jgi:hypothetical protein